MPDPGFYRECLEKSLADLKAAALKKGKLIKHKTKAEVTAARKKKDAAEHADAEVRTKENTAST